MDFKDMFKQTNAFAMQFGLILSLIWIGGFLSFIFSFKNPSLQTAYLLCTLAIPIMGWQFTRTFRKRICNNVISFGRAYLFSFLLYFYAGILLTAAFYIYFEFFDNGFFIDSYRHYLYQPEVKELLETPEMKQLIASMLNGASLTEMLDLFQDIPLSYIAANVLNFSVIVGVFLSLPTALFNTRTQKTNQ